MFFRTLAVCCLGLALLPAAPAGSAEPTATLVGIASVYAAKFQGRATASGERFDTAALTAAHRTLPFGTRVRVKNLRNGRSVVVRINDRGPFVAGRIIDVAPAAARTLGFLRAGTTRVRLEVLLPMAEEKPLLCLM